MSSGIAGTIEEIEMEELRTPRERCSKPGPSPGISLHQRMLSACTGSLITSLVVTPFDVVRIRLQQQQVLMPAVLAKSDQCCNSVFWQENTGELPIRKQANPAKAPVAEFCVTNTCAQDTKIKGTFSGISRIYATEGFPSLYRGLSLVLLMAIPSNVVYFSGYEYLRDASPINHYSVLNPLLCGSLARVLSATSVAPIELLKTRLQAIPTTTHLDSSKLMGLVLRNSFKEIQQCGISSLFRGLQITLWRDVPFSGIYWSSYELISHTLQKRVSFLSLKETELSPGVVSKNSKIDYKVFTTSFLSGCFSGIIAAVLTNPFDVGKTRLQVSAKKQQKTMFKFLFEIVRNEGPLALYVGLLPRCLKIAPACAIMISTYELSKRFFAS